KTCPLPVVETRKAIMGLEEGATEVIITVTLDNSAACANVTRFVESQGFSVSQEDHADATFTLTITRGFSCDLPAPVAAKVEAGKRGEKYLLYLNDSCMGRGDEKLGQVLMKAYLKTLAELDSLPETIIFVNRAVFLTISDSVELKTIKSLADSGCNILVCGTCLDFYNLKEQQAVGQVSNMFEIATLLNGSYKVVTP
ncbi:MAG: sulfurtransferase-like selenium metabolism protein YedF, partial [Pseudomonadota bacterium]|nr:sulfurtransferase-like selenium metabolism protein YedF [Pseudomonadota bacterium]